MKLVVAAALAVLVGSPLALSGDAAAQNAPKQTAAKKKPAPVAAAPAVVEQQPIATGPVSPSGNPEWDVYVNGQYVGSDPDPRIRWSIRQEAVGNQW